LREQSDRAGRGIDSVDIAREKTSDEDDIGLKGTGQKNNSQDPIHG
jgi:hypothetical protein